MRDIKAGDIVLVKGRKEGYWWEMGVVKLPGKEGYWLKPRGKELMEELKFYIRPERFKYIKISG